MKNLRSVFYCVLTVLVATFVLSSCKKDDDKKGPVTVIEDGVYLIGSSVASENITVDSRMQNGVYEGEGFAATPRAGMYQSVLFISSTGSFKIVEVKGSDKINYGATIAVDSEKDWAFSGDVTVDGSEISVAENGLYFVYVDLQADAKKIFVLKANEISVIGDGTGSGSIDIPLTKKDDAFSKTKGEWEVTNVNFRAGWWKFRMNQNWTYAIAEGVPAFTNLGGDVADLTPGGDNLPDLGLGVYTVTLKYEYGKGFSVTTKKTGEGEVVDYSNCELELVGTGVGAGNPGAVADGSSWGWGNVLSAGKPVVTNGVSTWTWANVELVGGEGFKLRTVGDAESGGVTPFSKGAEIITSAPEGTSTSGNIVVTADGNYNIVLTINAAEETFSLVITKL
ncbi:MAG: hypothetical protein LBN27_00355 [Prevotellaceae bacterium]|jgi:hypothetical protein|nr:hypothetical protein [Prevotellaceae bacterium]